MHDFVPDVENLDDTLANVQMLVVDDVADSRRMFREVAKSCGVARLTVVSSAQDALWALETQSFNVLMTDIHMPERHGTALIQRVRTHEQSRISYIGIVAITGDMRDSTVRKVMQAGADFYLVKPVSRINFAKRAQLAGKLADDRRYGIAYV